MATRQSKRHGAIRDELIGLELRALAELVADWARPEGLRKHIKTWHRRLPEMRQAVLAGLRRPELSGRTKRGPLSEKFPHEIVADEFAILEPVVQRLRAAVKGRGWVADQAWLKNTGIQKVDAEPCDVDRPLPCPQSYLATFSGDLANKALDTATIAAALTGARLGGLGVRTVTNARDTAKAGEDRKEERSSIQRLAASLFLDLCSFGMGSELQSLRVRLLDALYQSKYPPVMLYYLAQAGHKVPKEIALQPCAEAEISKVCNALRESSAAVVAAPFSQVLR
ncbi:MAG: hypothetical protein JW741_02810 [Sedimentisphaerales bacterium]|nr:hypothetical protein [Sedimentisphaerales bacterium]